MLMKKVQLCQNFNTFLYIFSGSGVINPDKLNLFFSYLLYLAVHVR